MPYLYIRTNQTVEDGGALIRQASELCAKMLAKPENYVMVSLEDGCRMCFSGNEEPLAYLELKSLGLPRDQAQDYSRQLCDFIAEQLGVSTSRIYIEFTAGDRSMWGYQRSTFG